MWVGVVVGVVVAISGATRWATGFSTPRQFGVNLLIAEASWAVAVWIIWRLGKGGRLSDQRGGAGARAATTIVLMAWSYLAIGLFTYGSAAKALGLGASMLPILAGFMLIASGLTRRVGDTKHCPGCEYEYRFTDDDAPIRCPECGQGWLGRLKTGRRVRSPRRIVAGVLVAVVFSIAFQPIFWLGSVARFLPTPVLGSIVYLLPETSGDGWDELSSRKLSEGWTLTLAKRFLSYRATTGTHLYGGDNWFNAMNAGGSLAPDLVERYYRESFVAELAGPSTARVGEAFDVKLRIRHAATSGSCGIIFGGYAAADQAFPRPRVEMTWMYSLSPSPLEPYKDVLPQQITADKRGPLRVRATYWLVFQGSFGGEVEADAEGSPKRPPNADWFERVELERTIMVE